MGELPRSLSRRDLIRWGLGLVAAPAAAAACRSLSSNPDSKPAATPIPAAMTQNERGRATSIALGTPIAQVSEKPAGNPVVRDRTIAPAVIVGEPERILNYGESARMDGRTISQNRIPDMVMTVRPRAVERIMEDPVIGLNATSLTDVGVALFLPINSETPAGMSELERILNNEAALLVAGYGKARNLTSGRALYGLVGVDTVFKEVQNGQGNSRNQTLNELMSDKIAEHWVKAIIARQHAPGLRDIGLADEVIKRIVSYRPFTVPAIDSVPFRNRTGS